MPSRSRDQLAGPHGAWRDNVIYEKYDRPLLLPIAVVFGLVCGVAGCLFTELLLVMRK